MNEFYNFTSIPLGCNASFINLIPKVENPLFIKYYMNISLISLQFKVIAKLLANRLVVVVHKVVGYEQSAFLKGLHILNGHVLVNDLVKR